MPWGGAPRIKNRRQPPPLDLPLRASQGAEDFVPRGDFRGVLEDGNLHTSLLSGSREVSLVLGFFSRTSTRTTTRTIFQERGGTLHFVPGRSVSKPRV